MSSSVNCLLKAAGAEEEWPVLPGPVLGRGMGCLDGTAITAGPSLVTFSSPNGVQTLRKQLLCGRWPQEMEHQDNASPAKAAGATLCAGAERDREKELPTAAHHSSSAEEFLGQDSSPGYVLAQFFHCCQAGRRTLI